MTVKKKQGRSINERKTFIAAIKELPRSGFEMKRLSILGRDHRTDEHVVGYHNGGDRMQVWGKTGVF